MNDINQYDLLMEALAELKPEIETARRLTPVPAHPSLRQTLAEFGSMPIMALDLGGAC